VRTDVGMFDVAHMCVVDIKGNVRGLRHLLANNVDKLQVSGKALYSCMLNPRHVIDDLIVYFINETGSAWWSTPAPPRRTWPGCSAEAGKHGLTITQRRDGGQCHGADRRAGPNARAKVWK
jgi:aminomethyltransferase